MYTNGLDCDGCVRACFAHQPAFFNVTPDLEEVKVPAENKIKEILELERTFWGSETSVKEILSCCEIIYDEAA